jgi:hypothetical protein
MAGESPDFSVSSNDLQAVLLLGTETVDGFLRELAALAARTLGDGLSCGMTLQPNGRPLTVASSDANAAQFDELQYTLDHGPCLTALRNGEEGSSGPRRPGWLSGSPGKRPSGSASRPGWPPRRC